MINPYKGVNWGTFQYIQSTTHMHHDRSFISMAEDGFKHLAISNYYPSKPYDMNLLNTSEFHTLPEGCMISPNAEHHNSIVNGQNYGSFHFNSLGSTWESGRAKVEGDNGPYGVQKDWKIAFKGILDALVFKDGGGITLNHPTWTGLSFTDAIQFLDYDDQRVLGIEIFNAPVTDSTAWALELWDDLLKTGRRVWGFCVTDHPKEEERPFQGRSVLLVDNFTEEECLKAYREGRFYGKIYNSDLRFTELSYTNGIVAAKTNNATSMKVIVDGVETVVNASEVTYTVPGGATYVRVEAHTDSDSIFSNPFILKPRRKRGMNKLMWY